MKLILDAKCVSCGNIDEVYGERSDTFRCSVCECDSKAIISPVTVAFKGQGFPGHDMKWARDHERAAQTKG